ncbi:Clr5 domain-containing protein [Bisporella sp. PMI_857]|nr:Clr5 domain-containing protein [Bisporella sp. PMI_857]
MDQVSGTSGQRNLPELSAKSSLTQSKRQITAEEWIALRPIIVRLYIDEGRTYEQVATILKSRYSFYPTKRQFHRKVLDWGLKKNTTTAERKRILEALSTQAISEQGRVGTVSLNPEKVLRWRTEATEKKSGEAEDNEESSSQDLPANSSTPVAMLNSAGAPVGLYNLDESIRNTKSRLQNRDFTVSTTATSRILQYLSMQPRRSPELSSPSVYQLPQELFFNIGKYYDASFQSKIWVPRPDRGYINIYMDLENYNIDKILGSCNTAGMLVKSKSFTEARRVLSAMFGLIKDIIKAEHPDTLNYFLLAFWYMKRDGLEEVIKMLRRHIGDMAIVVPNNNPWRRICQIIGALEPEQFQEAWFGVRILSFIPHTSNFPWSY